MTGNVIVMGIPSLRWNNTARYCIPGTAPSKWKHWKRIWCATLCFSVTTRTPGGCAITSNPTLSNAIGQFIMLAHARVARIFGRGSTTVDVAPVNEFTGTMLATTTTTTIERAKRLADIIVPPGTGGCGNVATIARYNSKRAEC